MSSPSLKTQHHFFLFIFIIAGWIMFLICRPFLGSLVLAASCAVVFYPLFRRINRAFGGRSNLAATCTVLIVLALVLTPLILIGSLLFGEVQALYASIVTHSSSTGGIEYIVNTLQNKVRFFIPDIRLDFTSYIEGALQWTVSNLNTFFSRFVGIFLNGLVMIFALFFLLRDGATFRDKLLVLSPLGKSYGEGIFVKITSAINSVIKGSLFIAVVQGIFAAIGFTAFGVPNPIIWGVAVMIASLIPGLGTALVTVPCIIFLFFTAPLWHAIVLACWAFLGVGLIDNFIAPSVLHRGIKIHPFLILLSVLGGISFFGPIGFIMGPIMLAFFFALLDIYPLIINNEQ